MPSKNGAHMTPESTPGPSNGVRRKAEEEELRLSKKPRTRVSYSCGECHRRKQKCDRQVPCSHCIARKVPELCKAYTPGKTDQDIHVRLARLEHIVETALPQYWVQGHTSGSPDFSSDRRRSISPGLEDGNRSQPEEEDPCGGMFESGRWFGKSASGSVAAPVVLEQLQHVEKLSAGDSISINQLPADIFHPESRLLSTLEPQNAADKLKLLISDYGFSPTKVPELINELPPRHLSTRLVDHYFSAVNWTRYPIPERDFRASYAAICAEGMMLNPNNIRFLPLLFVVLAISIRLAPEHVGGDERTRKVTSSRYYWSSRRALIIAAAIQPDCFEMVLTRMLSARFLILDRRMTESWNQLGAAVRTAQALGLHRDGADMGMDLVQVEKRRRIWSHLYHADRSIALVLGRPIAIQDVYTSTLPPSNVDDFATSDLRQPLPLTTPTLSTFMILRHTLAGIMGRMSHHFQQVRSASHYSDVLALDDELLKFMRSLPSYYAVDPDISLDQSHPYIPVHRFLLVTEILFVRISLHRPYLLRRLGSDRYLRSRKACFESALTDYRIRRAFLATTTKEARDPIASAYREFQAAMVSGIYLVLYPRGNDADSMHAVLDTFLKNHDQKELDETTRREVNIIQFLKDRSMQMAGAAGSDSTSNHKRVNVSANPLESPSKQVTFAPNHQVIPSSTAGPVLSNVPSLSITPVPTAGYAHPPARPPAIPHHMQAVESGSQSGTGSPPGGDVDSESTAQTLLDQWCNIFSGGPTDDSAGATSRLPWGTPGLADLSGWIPATSPIMGNDPLPGLDGSDWSYWESLVNQIRRASAQASPFGDSIIPTSRDMSKRPRSDPASSSGSDTAAPKKTRTIPPPPEPIPGPQANLTRILSWNVETPVPFLQLPPRKVGTSVAPGTRLSLLRDLLIRHDLPDFVCLQEVRARQTDKAWISALHNAANYHRKGGPKYSMYTALNQAKTGQRHFGVVTYVKDRERVAIAREVDWDAEGRVLILEMKSGWALVNVYALNGSEYMWRDLTLKSAPKTRNERKREFNRLLLQECRAMQERGLRLVLTGDFNISLTKRDCVPRLRTEHPHSLARKEFNDEFIPGLDLVDVYRALHGDRPAFSWFAKGKPQGADCARVDYALVERSLMDSVVDSTYFEDSTERGHSDHAPFILTLQDLHVLKAAPDPSILHLSAEPTSSNG
ncbi:uncharacterized protein LAESUDRAFT_688987 [Laetiporus sulphureus 93-53]|uniref:Zn(2)-C6 fungal-type domain-containing protein n=1 Tax=Laetiporus sulphureus 93-53 TaxID=1314785 RepID=A0A165I1B6_9APHY|nr:uncharacterized protein LAESUDRAFT_688987 [Laetiporus sulphureus 93-53]KZT12462.1 hypothetical protein LAESUDRAFT_688987 [Laetiporus sulphureus 93-53]